MIIRSKIELFITALIQVSFVSMNVIFISQHKWIPLLLTGFMISIIWTLNVKKVAFGDWLDRFIYAFGAMVGTGIGVLFSSYLINKI